MPHAVQRADSAGRPWANNFRSASGQRSPLHRARVQPGVVRCSHPELMKGKKNQEPIILCQNIEAHMNNTHRQPPLKTRHAHPAANETLINVFSHRALNQTADQNALERINREVRGDPGGRVLSDGNAALMWSASG